MAPSARAVRRAVKRSGVRYELVKGWNDKSIGARTEGPWEPQYVILHHTANGGARGNAPSLNWVVNNEFKPVRACHFLVGRDGKVYVVYAYRCYHAGSGGPGKWGNGTFVGEDRMNNFSFGIEIESKGTAKVPTAKDPTNGYTKAQVQATAKLTAELQRLMGKNVKTAINHRTWARGRKTDTLRTDNWWKKRIRPYRWPRKRLKRII